MKIIISNLQKKAINQNLLKNQARRILCREGVSSGELSLVLVNDRTIKKLNREFLSKKYPTDVLAFDLSLRKSAPEKKKIFGEIIISTDTAKRNSRIFNTDFKYEITLYLVHGILHLLGFDDTGSNKIKLMRKKEIELMQYLGMA